MPTAVLTPLRESGLLIKANPANGSFTDSGAAFFHVAEGWDLDPGIETFDVMHNGNVIGTRNKSMLPKLTGKAVGEIEHLSTLYPNLTANLGARIVGATDVAFMFITPSGRKWAIPRGAFTQRPSLTPVVGQTALGDFELTMLYSRTAGNHYTYTTGATHPGYASFDLSTILTLNPAVSFGTGVFDELYPSAGVEFDFAWQLTPVYDGMQVVDYTIDSQTLTAKCQPQSDAAFTDWETKMGMDLPPGSTLPVANFIANFTGLYVMLYNAEARVEKFKFSHKENFVTGIVARAMQRYSTGTAVALGYVGASAPA